MKNIVTIPGIKFIVATTIGIIMASFSALAQNSRNFDCVVAVAEYFEVARPVNAGLSQILDFRIIEVLEGTASDSVISSQDVSWDFGVKSIMPKIFPGWLKNEHDSLPNEVVIKYCHYELDFPEMTVTDLVWVAESDGVEEIKTLERLVLSRLKIGEDGSAYEEMYLTLLRDLLLDEFDQTLIFRDTTGTTLIAVMDEREEWLLAIRDEDQSANDPPEGARKLGLRRYFTSVDGVSKVYIKHDNGYMTSGTIIEW